ncbi:hypothetical protein TWF481_002130 [Arthrobotrys musiformis]|uniref:Uncharacterized protein n=1 Tax=Arthrobotrys musiformis TaxID=47236 RepID=A0AAV9VSA9_9PEZI
MKFGSAVVFTAILFAKTAFAVPIAEPVPEDASGRRLDARSQSSDEVMNKRAPSPIILCAGR